MAESKDGTGRASVRAPFTCDSKMILFSGRPTSWYEVEMVTGRADLRGNLVPDSVIMCWTIISMVMTRQRTSLYGWEMTVGQMF